MKKFETLWQVIQDIHIIQEGGCCFEKESMLKKFIEEKRKEFPDCRVVVYHEFWTTIHCSLVYEEHLNSLNKNDENDTDEDDSNLFGSINTAGDC